MENDFVQLTSYFIGVSVQILLKNLFYWSQISSQKVNIEHYFEKFL